MPRRFDFVSPGVQLTEIDQSILENESTDDGALIIGTARTGPGMRPVRLRNKAHLFDVFGEPSAGIVGGDSDVWRNGNDVAPTYGLYAAQAWLASETSPVTFVRLLGNDSNNKGSSYTYAGWNLGSSEAAPTHDPREDGTANVGAYGLWLVPSCSLGLVDGSRRDGVLAAIIYVSGGVPTLSGTIAGAAGAVTPTVPGVSMTSSLATLIDSSADNATFNIDIIGTDSTALESFGVNFDYTSPNFIRNVMNTNPQRLDAGNFSTATKTYWVGQTYERDVARKITAHSSSAGKVLGVMWPLFSSSLGVHENQREAQPAKTGWFINRTTLTGSVNIAAYNCARQDKLFRLVSLSEGEYFQGKYYVTIDDLRVGNSVRKDSTFSVSVREYNGKVVEKFSNLNLDPNSPDYISARIGDEDVTWDQSNLKFTTTGRFPNMSDYVRVEIASGVENGTISDSQKLPMGFLGPLRPQGFAIISGSGVGSKAAYGTPIYKYGETDQQSTELHLNLFMSGAGNGGFGCPNAGNVLNLTAALGPGNGYPASSTTNWLTASFRWPDLQLTEQTSSANSTNFLFSDHFGINVENATLNNSHIDLLRELPSDSENSAAASVHVAETDLAPYAQLEHSFVFSLDDVIQSNGKYYWESGSFEAGTSYAAINGGTALLDTAKVRQYAAPFFGGTDGVDVTKTQPFANTVLDSQDESKHYAYYSVDKVLDIAREPELVSYDVLTLPGLTNNTLNDKIINACEDRGDALAIIDVSGIYKPEYENNGVASNGSIADVVSTVKSRQNNSTAFDSSYAATYYPSLRLTGDDGASLVVPPSVGAVGALAKTDALKALWFAPAGFNQGGLAELGGRDGPRVVGVNEVLKKSERDQLYQLNVNPIARLSNQIVIFGQKTLQQTPSALDRVNVRRLMIYIKKRIGDLANTILFDQNLQATWNRFNAGADKVLSAIQSEYGLEEYKIVLDSSTTTPDLVDRNILYAKIYIKPARSIEFIAVDFVITRSGIEL